MSRDREQPHFVPYVRAVGFWRLVESCCSLVEAYGWWSLAVDKNEISSNGRKGKGHGPDKQLLYAAASQRTRFLAARGMISLEMAVRYQLTTISYQPNSKSLPGGASPERLIVKILGSCEVSSRRRLVFLFLLCSLFLGCHEVFFLRELFPLQGAFDGATCPITESSPTRGMGPPINTRYCGSVTAMSIEFFIFGLRVRHSDRSENPLSTACRYRFLAGMTSV
jgi:hypothetical protein